MWLRVTKIDLIYQQAFAEALILVCFSSRNFLEDFVKNNRDGATICQQG